MDHRKDILSCHLCGYGTRLSNTFLQHMKRHQDCIEYFSCDSKFSPKFEYHCEKCPFKTTLKVFLTKHIINNSHESLGLRSPVPLRRCKYCQFQSYSLLVLLAHGAVCREKYGWFRCRKCTFKCRKAVYLKMHLRYNHNWSEWFFCLRCAYKAKRKYELRMHLRRAHPKIFDDVEIFQAIFSRIHTVKEGTAILWLVCNKCSFKTKYKNTMNRHIESRHTTYM